MRMLTQRVEDIRLGSALLRPTDGVIPTVYCGSMISDARFAHLNRVLESAEMHGAIIEAGGRPFKHSFLNGAYYEPTVVGNVNPDSEIAQTESRLFDYKGDYAVLTLYLQCLHQLHSS